MIFIIRFRANFIKPIHLNFINDIKFSLTKNDLPTSFAFFIFVFWVVLAFAPADLYATEGFYTKFQTICTKEFFKFTIYQILGFGMLIFLISFKKETRTVRYATPFLIGSVLVFVVSIFNPYNDLKLQEYLYYDNVFPFYFMILLFGLIISVKREVYLLVFNTICTIGLYVLLILCIESDLLYFIGKGNIFFGSFPSTIPQMDLLIYISVFQLLMLIQYLKTMERKYLIYLAIFLVTLLFSYRRSALMVGLMADVILFAYYFHVTPVKTRASRIILTCLLVGAGAVITFSAAAPDKFNNLFNRYIGAFSYFSKANIKSDDEFSDSGHMEQSLETTQIFFSRVGDTFWGAGFGNRPYYVEGQAEDGALFLGYIHNSFVYAWAQWGTQATIYLLFLVLLMISILLKLIATKNQNLTVAGMIIYLLGFLVLGWSNGIIFLGKLHYTFLFVFLFSVIKFLPQPNEAIPQNSNYK